MQHTTTLFFILILGNTMIQAMNTSALMDIDTITTPINSIFNSQDEDRKIRLRFQAMQILTTSQKVAPIQSYPIPVPVQSYPIPVNSDMHNSTPTVYPTLIPVVRTLACPFGCGHTYVESTALLRHRKNYHSAMFPYSCKYCARPYTRPSYKTRHEESCKLLQPKS